MRLAILTAALLAGCAVPASQVGDFRLCEFTMSGGDDAMVAQREARRRGLDCRQYYSAILQKRQADANALNNAAQFFNRPAAPMPAPVTCDSVRLGHRVETVCR
jgi:hypothetical protein